MHENGVLLSLLCVNGQKRSSLIMILVADFSHVKILKKANNQKKKHEEEECIRCFQGRNLGFVEGVNTHPNALTWASRRTQQPGTRVEPQLPIRGHYCQTVEHKLPGALITDLPPATIQLQIR